RRALPSGAALLRRGDHAGAGALLAVPVDIAHGAEPRRPLGGRRLRAPGARVLPPAAHRAPPEPRCARGGGGALHPRAPDPARVADRVRAVAGPEPAARAPAERGRL